MLAEETNQPIEILAVEDDPADAALLKCALESDASLPVRFTLALRLADAVELIQSRIFDVILADLNLPDSEGLSTLTRIRHAAPDTPIVIITGAARQRLDEQVLSAGAQDLLAKEDVRFLARIVPHAIRREKMRSKLNQRVRESILNEERVRSIIETTSDATLIVDAHGIVRFVNTAAEQMFGRNRREFVGQPFGSPIAGDSLAHATEIDFVNSDGAPGVAEMRAVQITWDRGTAYLASLRDVTERRKMEQQLKQALARLQAVIANAPLFLWAVDPNGTITVSEGRLLENLGGESKKLVSGSVFDLFRNNSKAAEVHARALQGEFVHDKIELPGLVIEARYTPMFDESGNFVGTIGMGIDVTDRVRAEALQKFEAIGRLAGGIAHDFNNALGVILAWAEFGLENPGADAQIRSQLEKISRQARHAAGLTAQLLAFARRQVLQPKPLLLNQIVTDVSRLLGTAIGDEIEFSTRCAPDLCQVRADQTQIEQVLLNLCLNARDAMPNGGRLKIETENVAIVEGAAEQVPFGRPGRYVLLSVSDTGVGMDEVTQSRIFEPFFTTKEQGKGTGLGLATVFGIVQQHDGFVTVASEIGRGTTFKVYLPAFAGHRSSDRPAPAEQLLRGTETILVAEDHEGLREIDVQALSSAGYRVLTAKDGEEAIRIFKSNFDGIKLVVLDVAMPRLSGPVAFQQLRAIKRDIPVIFKTGYMEEMTSLDSSIHEAAGFLQKPYSAREFCHAVRAALDKIPAGQESPGSLSAVHGFDS